MGLATMLATLWDWSLYHCFESPGDGLSQGSSQKSWTWSDNSFRPACDWRFAWGSLWAIHDEGESLEAYLHLMGVHDCLANESAMKKILPNINLFPLRIKNFWALHCLVKFSAFQTRCPSKQELEIVLESFNSKFKAGRGSEHGLSKYHTNTQTVLVYSNIHLPSSTDQIPAHRGFVLGPCHQGNRWWPWALAQSSQRLECGLNCQGQVLINTSHTNQKTASCVQPQDYECMMDRNIHRLQKLWSGLRRTET